MRPQHYVLLSVALGTLSTQLNSIHDWHAALTPSFIAGVLASVSTVIATFSRSPQDAIAVQATGAPAQKQP